MRSLTETVLSSHEALFRIPSPSIKHMCVFGCKLSYVVDTEKKLKYEKFTPLVANGMNLGHKKWGAFYSYTIKGAQDKTRYVI